MNEQHPSVLTGLCECGCGQTTTVHRGKSRRFVYGHQHRHPERHARIAEYREAWAKAKIPYGHCLCGCGEKTELWDDSDYKRNRIVGEPRYWVRQHDKHATPERWRAEDRGYTTPCWIWQWSYLRSGYGNGGGTTAQRRVYTELVGPIPEGLDLDHLCRVRACVNPEHLEPVTRTVNVRRGIGPKLSERAAREIRAEYDGWGGTKYSFCRMVAARHDMHPCSIDYLLAGRTWKAA